MASAPRARSWATAAALFSSLRPASAIRRQPSSTSCSAMAKPMPCAPPVMTAIVPSLRLVSSDIDRAPSEIPACYRESLDLGRVRRVFLPVRLARFVPALVLLALPAGAERISRFSLLPRARHRSGRPHRQSPSRAEEGVAPGSHYIPSSNLFLTARSEEHTSELQSRLHLVCRLLLEKKKKTKDDKLSWND